MPGFENYGLDSDLLVNPNYIPSFSELSTRYPEQYSSLLDQTEYRLKNPTADQQHWRDYGYVIKRNFIPNDLVDEYLRFRDKLSLGNQGFPDVHPHLYSSVIRDISCSRELHHLLVDLLGEEMGLAFSLNGFTSTERGWHQDDYFNPEDSVARYAAIWMAMGDIDPDSGPFEFVPGSHKWPCLRQEKIFEWLKPEAALTDKVEWMYAAEYFVNKAVEEEIRATGSRVAHFDAKKGDILIWHAKLMHRGSIPKNPALIRPALISHYASIRYRHNAPGIYRHGDGDGGYFWEYADLGEVLSEDKVPRSNAANQPTTSNSDPTKLRAEISRMREMVAELEASLREIDSRLDSSSSKSESRRESLTDITRTVERPNLASRQNGKWQRVLGRLGRR
jgi:hypothetical protein